MNLLIYSSDVTVNVWSEDFNRVVLKFFLYYILGHNGWVASRTPLILKRFYQNWQLYDAIIWIKYISISN